MKMTAFPNISPARASWHQHAAARIQPRQSRCLAKPMATRRTPRGGPTLFGDLQLNSNLWAGLPTTRWALITEDRMVPVPTKSSFLQERDAAVGLPAVRVRPFTQPRLHSPKQPPTSPGSARRLVQGHCVFGETF